MRALTAASCTSVGVAHPPRNSASRIRGNGPHMREVGASVAAFKLCQDFEMSVRPEQVFREVCRLLAAWPDFGLALK